MSKTLINKINNLMQIIHKIIFKKILNNNFPNLLKIYLKKISSTLIMNEIIVNFTKTDKIFKFII